MNDFYVYYAECQCFTSEHMLKFTSIDGEVYATIFLCNAVWYKRLWYAIKYIFGYKCRYGHFQDWLCRPEDIDAIIDLLSKAKEFTKQNQ